ncbi:MAG TPA: HlyD family efflux transporter periplasmic adaptor subunit [Steroidobacteraceae bacterium]|nr:HlyD family efflux transporter periplasmic adaptor subunit [Steroidobacteraceae bacterium]
MNTETQDAAPASANSPANGRRNRLLLLVTLGIVVIGIGYGLYWYSVLRLRESTDDAYVNGNIVQITPQIAGTVIGINADDTQYVSAGQTLVRLDPADAKVALDEAEAHLALTVRSVRGEFATTAQLAAAQGIRQTDLETAQKDLARRERLAGSGAISGEELQHARDAVSAANSALLAAQQQFAADHARIDGTQIEDHPEVQAAASAVHSAFLTVARTQLPVPVAGYVAHRNVQLGQRVSPGSVLMAIVPLNQVWVDANFKELQIANMRMGQPATLTADLYGGSVKYHGTVVGFSAGTGAAFALLPAQNATGNWIKVVQRLPVRIVLDPKDLAAHPLQVGLSMRVEVSTANRDGARLPQQTVANAPAYATNVFDDADRQAQARVEAIIAANLPAPPRGHVARRLVQAPTRPAT